MENNKLNKKELKRQKRQAKLIRESEQYETIKKLKLSELENGKSEKEFQDVSTVKVRYFGICKFNHFIICF